MFVELTPCVERGPQLINIEMISHLEPVKSSQVNFTRLYFADFSTTLDVHEKYEEVKLILRKARLVLEAAESSDSAHAAHTLEAA